jgi:hypothetical protein
LFFNTLQLESRNWIRYTEAWIWGFVR